MNIPFTQLPYYQDFVVSTDPARRIQIVRDYCNVLLMLSDWTVMQYSPTDTNAWSIYRDQVRSFVDTYDPNDINPVFPAQPEIVLIAPNGEEDVH